MSLCFTRNDVGGSNAPVASADSVVATTRSDYELGASGNLLVLHTVDNFGRDEREYHHEFGFIDNLGNRTLFVRDMLGSVRAVLKNGTMVEWNDYYAYGAVRDSWSLVSGRWQYLGLEYDSETGSLHTHARECFNLEGFFNKLDRFAFKYPSQTPYGYAKQNPFRYHDASGDSVSTLINEGTPIPPWRIDPVVNPVDVYLTVTPMVVLRQGSKALANFIVNFIKRLLKGDANETDMPTEITEPNQNNDTEMVDPRELTPTHTIAGRKSQKKVQEIKNDIEKKGGANGIREPLDIVTDRETGEKYIIDGHHRHRAALEKGLKKVPTREINLPHKGYKNIKDIKDASAETGIR